MVESVPCVANPLVGLLLSNFRRKIVVMSHLVRRDHYTMVPKKGNNCLRGEINGIKTLDILL